MNEKKNNILNLLIVDDEPSITNTLKRILKNNKINTYTAESYEEAMEISKKLPVDILITDYLMVDVNGTYLIKKLKEIDDDIYIIFFTGNPSFLPSKIAKEKYHVDKYIEKSDSFEELIESLNEAIIIKGYLNEKKKNKQIMKYKVTTEKDKNIHMKIKEERIKLKLTQKQLAKKLNVTRGTIANYESTKIPPNNQLIELAKIFNVSIDYLLISN